MNETDTDFVSGYDWVPFHTRIATKLLTYKDNRKYLLSEISKIAENFEDLRNIFTFNDEFSDGSRGPIEDICPFTFFTIFTGDYRPEKRTSAARKIAEILEEDLEPPENFDGIPVVPPLSRWFFSYAKQRDPKDIDTLWNMFESALRYADETTENVRLEFVTNFHKTLNVRQVGLANLTMGLYWSRPLSYLALDRQNQQYLPHRLEISLDTKNLRDGEQYLGLVRNIQEQFSSSGNQLKNFPSLSHAAWLDRFDLKKLIDEEKKRRRDHEQKKKKRTVKDDVVHQYTPSDILSEGCFLTEDRLAEIHNRIERKKNLILQGPPGTGKTWIAKRIGWVLIGKKQSTNLTAVQFHPNLSYEDFVRGFRPTGGGTLAVEDGVFMNAIENALNEPDEKFVVVIEEINRGNPAQIFGELLTLLEADKRNEEEALALTYAHPDRSTQSVYLPPNLYVIGTMNLADRSLALVDFALRRRFAFEDLKPELTSRWRSWVVEELGVDENLVQDIAKSINSVNEKIQEDKRLGSAYVIGHSFVTPPSRLESGGTKAWFLDVVDTELLPLLNEYWFDEPEKVEEAKLILTENW